jgi:uncharacterized repeat protein (TIGR01451 family)
MRSCLRSLPLSMAGLRARTLLGVLLCTSLAFGCADDTDDGAADTANQTDSDGSDGSNDDTDGLDATDGDDSTDGTDGSDGVVAPTVGTLNVNVQPQTAEVVVTGPDAYEETFTGSRLLLDLAPGDYVATAKATGFGEAVSQINVEAGQTSSLVLILFTTASGDGLGALNVNVNPASASVALTGPDGYTFDFNGNYLVTGLAQGIYTAVVAAPGYGGAVGSINVELGQTSQIAFNLLATPIISASARAVYRDAQGNLIPITPGLLLAGHFVFYAWLHDETLGINTAPILGGPDADPGEPLATEQNETAPSFTQNLGAVWVGFRDTAGVIRPVIGADIRWEIDQWWTERVGSLQFGTSDDNRIALGYGISDDQADTRTNNGTLETESFPLVSTDYPLYNQSGVATPFIDGFSWVTFFSPDPRASGRIVVVASVNGAEIGKQIIYKNFAPQPILEIEKSVNKDIVNITGGTASVIWSVTVRNVGTGAATAVDVSDLLAQGVATSYALSGLPAGAIAVGDGFTTTFPLAAAGDVGDEVTFTFTATVTEPGTYCNAAKVTQYADGPATWTPTGLEDDACFTALESNVSIVKDFVAADGITSLGKARTVAANVPVALRIRVLNNGSGVATGVAVNDIVSSGDKTKYEVLPGAPGTANASDGFDVAIGTLAVGATETLLFDVKASADGKYCDTATVTATSGSIGIASDTACLTVASPALTITKVNLPTTVLPGESYVSTISVKNTGNAAAQNVVIADLLGLNETVDVSAIYVSSSLNGLAGTVAGKLVTSPTMSIPAGETRIFTVVSRIAPGAVSGSYCDVGSFTSSNVPSKEAKACVQVPAFSAFQTQLVDLNDPVAIGNNVTYFSTLFVEALSNEGVKNNVVTYSFGLVSPTTLGIAGIFDLVSTKVYRDSAPVRDPVTGLVVSDTASPTASLLVLGTDYTLNDSTDGLQVITMTPGFVIAPNTALYMLHVVKVPAGTTANKLYTTSYIWKSVGNGVVPETYEASTSEPTTVLP